MIPRIPVALIPRILAVLAGVAALGLGAHYVVLESGMAGTNLAMLTYGGVGIIAAAALAASSATSSGRYIIAGGLTVVLMASELATLATLTESVAVDRAEAAAVIETKRAERRRAVARVADLRAGIPVTTSRLDHALASLERAENAQAAATTQSGCRKLCSADLRARVARAAAEVVAARTDLERRQGEARAALSEAEAALAAIPRARSSTVLADILGLPARFVDLAVAALRSLSVNGSGIFLIVFGSKGRRREVGPEVEPETGLEIGRAAGTSPASNAERYIADRLVPRAGGYIALLDVEADLARWARANGTERPSDRAIFEAMERAGLQAIVDDGVPCVPGVEFAPLLLAVGGHAVG